MTAAAAAALPDLHAVAALARACRACPELAAARTHVVPGDFPAGARLLLVGEAPGAQEDAAGRPFVGKAGRLLDQVLAQAGLPREQVAVGNVLKCRPPGNRAPTRAEVARCRGWLDRQLELLAPALVVTLGGSAAAWAFGRPVRLADVRGRVHVLGGRHLLPTYHPSAAIRFGPNGAPLKALRDDLALAARTLRA